MPFNWLIKTEHWVTKKDRDIGSEKIDHLYRSSLPIISKILGNLHSVSKDTRFWEVALGNWIMSFAVIYEDRLKCYKLNKDKKNFIDSLNQEFGYKPPSNLQKFYASTVSSKSFNNQMLLCIHNFFNKGDKNKDFNFNKNEIGIDFKYFPLFKVIVLRLFKDVKYAFHIFEIIIINIISIFFRNNMILVCCSSFFDNNYFKVLFKSLLKINRFPLFFFQREISINKTNIELRESLAYSKKFSGTENQLFLRLVLLNLPTCYIENFKYNYFLLSLLFFKPKLILSDTHHIHNIYLKLLMAKSKISDRSILIHQHAANNGLLSWDLMTNYDRDISNLYYSWGWNSMDVKVMPSIRLSKFKRFYYKKKLSRRTNQVYYVCRALSSLQMGGGFGGDTVTDSNLIIEGRKKINKNIDLLNDANFVVRPRPGDIHGFLSNSVEQFRSNKIKIAMKEESQVFNYFKSSVVIFESLSTGLFECLVVKKPVILFINESYLIQNNKHIKNFMKKMTQLGLVSLDVHSLFFILNQDIGKWWNGIVNREAYDDLIQSFAKTSDSYLDDWITELLTYKN